jgi:hypothetical protein
MGKYEQFIKAMQEKYYGVFSGGQGIDGVPLHAVAPADLSKGGYVGNPIAVPAGQGAGTGARYTGRGPDNIAQPSRPAGIVDEDEMVIESPMLKRIGGPEATREGLEVLADMKQKGVARSFQEGTGFRTAGDANAAWDAWKKKANYSEATHGTEASLRPVFDKWHSQYGSSGKDFNQNINQSDWASTYGTPSANNAGATGTGAGSANGAAGGTNVPPVNYTPQSLGMPKAPDPVTAADATAGMAQRGDSRFSGVTDEAMKNLQDIASGNSDAMKTVSQVQGRQLAGVQAARSSRLGQELAQQGVEGGAARVAQAMERRQAGTEQAQLKGQLAVEEQQRRERATSQLVSAGLQGEQLEEAQHQFDVGIQKWGKEFEEASKQWGANFKQRQAEFTQTANQWGKEFALAQEKFNYGKAQDTIQAQLAAGDFDGAAATYKNLGVTINVDSLKDAKVREDIGNAMSDFADYSITFGANSPQAKGALEKVFKLQNPGVDITTPEGKALMDDYVTKSTSSYEIESSPYRSALESMFPADDEATAAKNAGILASSFGIENLDDFEFNGSKGQDAMKDWYTAYLMNPAAMNNPNSALYKAVNPQEEGGLITEQGGYNLDTDDPFGAKADQLLKQPRTDKNSVVYDAVVKSRTEKMFTDNDFSSLKGMDVNSPIYKAALDKLTDLPMKATYRQKTSGLNAEIYGIDLPAGTKAGSPMKIDGKLYTFSRQLPDNIIDQTWPKPNKRELRYEVTDPITGQKKILRAKGDSTVAFE